MNSAIETSFVETLLQSARPYPIAENPFVVSLRRGECTGEQIRRYAGMIAVAAIGFPRVLSKILTHCDRQDVRASVLANLMEEEGIVRYRAGEGIVVDARRNHAGMARRFAAAAGVSPEALEIPLGTAYSRLRLAREAFRRAVRSVSQRQNLVRLGRVP